jgi:surface protein
MESMFEDCTSLKNVQLNYNLNKSINVTNASKMFKGCGVLTEVSGVPCGNSTTDMSSLFENCYKLTSISGLESLSVTNMSNMFKNCSALSTINLSRINTSNVTNMDGAFNGCPKLSSITVTYNYFNIDKVNKKTNVFRNIGNLTVWVVFNEIGARRTYTNEEKKKLVANYQTKINQKLGVDLVFKAYGVPYY